MALRFAFLLLLSVCAFGAGIAAPAFPMTPEDAKCGLNQEFQACGSACVPDCANPEEPKICTLQCVIGCFCKKGYLKNAQGECVLPHECDARTHHEIPMQFPSADNVPQCPANEEFNACGSACAPNCANPHPSPICTKNCVVGCFCKEGHLRNGNGLCVPTHQCEAPQTSMLFAYPPEVSQCKENEIFMPCGSACAPTCANPRPAEMCTLQCVVGCFCKPGYLKNEHGACVPSVSCGVPAAEAMPLPPKICDDTEEYRQCKGCDGTCQKPNPICPRICVPGCACKEGHVRQNGKCVLTRECPAPVEAMMLPPRHQCAQNEEYKQCKGCDGTCKNRFVPCPLVCIPGCACKKDYVRENGVCIMALQCPQIDPIPPMNNFMMLPPVEKCGENEIFRACGTACPATCANPHPSPVCTKQCIIGCACKEGFLKNAQGVCVAAANCDAAAVSHPDPRGPVHIPLYKAPLQPEGQCSSDREIFSECGTQLDCLATCGTPLPYLIHGYPQMPKKCMERMCSPGCVCKHPYVRHADGRCVERQECDKVNPFAA